LENTDFSICVFESIRFVCSKIEVLHIRRNNLDHMIKEDYYYMYKVNIVPKQYLMFSVPGSSLGAGIVTDKSFKSLEGRVCANTLDGIKDMGFTHMTEIQAMAIPHLLEGR
jgi:hypothetical protein